MKFLGRHFLVEYHRCDPKILNDLEKVKKLMLEAASRSGATVLDASFHYFSPQGVSGVVVIAESHLAIHTWPEYDYAAVDIFTCGTRVDPWKAFHYLKSTLDSKESSVNEIIRGDLSHFDSQVRRLYI
ncbi:MAG: S-adenosylmethionine decarboxylase proenzyme [Deltaproteobacteria bacterium]|nr:S-adenosylmethionine decarboxylase proenzyme [Deltaproteobacteria bacterium]